MSEGADDLLAYWRVVQVEVAAATRAPLSVRRALRCAVLIDGVADHVFATYRHRAPEKVRDALDSLAYRAALRSASPDLGLIDSLCRGDVEGPRLLRRPVPVADASVAHLDVADAMVCVYNAQSVETVLIESQDGATEPCAAILSRAHAWWMREFAVQGL